MRFDSMKPLAMASATTLGIIAAAVVASSCSLATTDRVSCSNDTQCATFGAGFVCRSDGYCGSVADNCSTTAQCTAALGFSYTCDASSKCVRARIHPRCTKTFPPLLLEDPSRFDNPIVFGSIAERTFQGDEVVEKAAELAITQANEQGGLGARSFGMVFCTVDEDPIYDDLDTTEAAVETATYLTRELGVPAIHGPSTSGGAQQAFSALRDDGVLMISASATSPALFTLDNIAPTDDAPGLLWRTVPPDSFQAVTIAQDMRARGINTVALIAESGPYGEGVQQAFGDAFTGMGGQLATGQPLPFMSGSTSQRDAQITAALDAGVNPPAEEILFVTGETSDLIAFIDNLAGQSNFGTKSVFLTDTAGTDDLFGVSAGGRAILERTRVTRPAPASGTVFDAFAGAYAAANGGQDVRQFSFAAPGYDAAWLMMYGAAWSVFQDGGSITGLGIAKGLRRISSGTEFTVTPGNWPSIRQQFSQGTAVDLRGASGDLDVNPATEEIAAPIAVTAIRDCSGLEFVTVSVGTAAPPCP